MKKLEHREYIEEILCHSSFFTLDEFAKTVEKIEGELVIGSIYSISTKKGNLITVYAEFKGEKDNTPYNIFIKGNSEKDVKDITNKIKKKIQKEEQKLYPYSIAKYC